MAIFMVESSGALEGKEAKLGVVNLHDIPYGEEIVEALRHVEHESEREYRYRVTELPCEGFKCNRTQVIQQGYFKGRFLNASNVAEEHLIRVREAWNPEQGSRYRLAYKTEVIPGDRTHRIEHGSKIMDAWFPGLWKLTEGNRIAKVRFYDENSAPDFDIHLDVFVDPPELTGLVIAEFEFKDEAASERFDPMQYPWLGEVLTKKKGWGNSSMATRGLPKSAYPSSLDGHPLRHLVVQAEEEYAKLRSVSTIADPIDLNAFHVPETSYQAKAI
jgi:CYTH domain-containing protein